MSCSNSVVTRACWPRMRTLAVMKRLARSLATFAAKGYAVLRPSPRGSSGYGKKFRFANYKDWGGMDYQDLMAGVDHAIAMGVADPDRLAVMGWSYGGFMTSWVITQTDRFKAAVIGAPVTNLWSFTGTADIPDSTRVIGGILIERAIGEGRG